MGMQNFQQRYFCFICESSEMIPAQQIVKVQLNAGFQNCLFCAFGVPSLNVTCLGAAERWLSQQDALRIFHITAES